MTGQEPGRVLVAGIGNLFFGDDGFGPAVVEQLRGADLPASVDVVDFGIRGVHLAYELLDARYATVVLVDALPMSEPPGTLAVLHVDDPERFGGQLDAHSMSPAAVLAALAALGGSMPRVLVVGCQPEVLDPVMALSEPVAASVAEAAELVREVAYEEVSRLGVARLVDVKEA